MLHSNKRYPRPDRRGGRMNQPRPIYPRHHVHHMTALDAEGQVTACLLCDYMEVMGKSVGGPKRRTRADVSSSSEQESEGAA